MGEFRWSQLASSGDGLFEPARRVVGRGEYRGLTFHEVEARSIISKAPPNTPWFGYSINAYRGCSHGCTYCIWGGTPILMADGRAKPMSAIRPGDEVYGTTRNGAYRRYVGSRVLAHWSTVKPAYRLVLEDGTELIASADHRFLSDRGWKHVIGSEVGRNQRPHLTTNNKLVGVGRFAEAPEHTEEYRRGYLCGLIRGDGHVGAHLNRGKIPPQIAHQFRLAMVDREAILRAGDFLADFGVATDEFLFQRATPARKELVAIRTQVRHRVGTIREIISWPDTSCIDWRKGFLAGIFDAEGSSGEVLRISNTDPDILNAIQICMEDLGFSFRVERTPGRATNIRLLGGLRERLRFYLTVDPAITRKRTFLGLAVKGDAPLQVKTIEPLGFSIPMYDLTTSTGDFVANGVISHNCFARPTHDYLGFNMGSDFETQIVVKVNAVDLLRAELSPARWGGDHIAMGTNTDPYQPAEGKYKLTRGIIQQLVAHRNSFSILTKSPLVLRDLDLLLEATKTTEVRVDFSIATMDEDVWRRTEPGVPHPRRRMEAVAKLRNAGIRSGVMMAPIIPGISDHPTQIAEVRAAAREAGAESVHEVRLHLRGVRSHFLEWLKNDSPELLPMYLEMYPERRKTKSRIKPARDSDVSQLPLPFNNPTRIAEPSQSDTAGSTP